MRIVPIIRSALMEAQTSCNVPGMSTKRGQKSAQYFKIQVEKHKLNTEMIYTACCSLIMKNQVVQQRGNETNPNGKKKADLS
jgi:hypothetical protein